MGGAGLLGGGGDVGLEDFGCFGCLGVSLVFWHGGEEVKIYLVEVELVGCLRGRREGRAGPLGCHR